MDVVTSDKFNHNNKKLNPNKKVEEEKQKNCLKVGALLFGKKVDILKEK